VLRLAPEVRCDTTSYWLVVFVLVIPSFVGLTVLFPVFLHRAFNADVESSSSAEVAGFLQAPLRPSMRRALTVPLFFGRKFLFAALIGGARSSGRLNACRARVVMKYSARDEPCVRAQTTA
jgi:hypothetical protein